MSVRLPRLLTISDGRMEEVARLHPTKASITLNAEPLNTASLTLSASDQAVQVGDFVEMFVPGKSAGIFRVSSVSTDYGKGGQSVKLEHGLVTMGDAIVPGEHIFYGWTDGDYTVTGYVAVNGWHNRYDTKTALPMFGTNQNKTSFIAQAPAGTVLPALAKTDAGYRILYDADVNRVAPTTNGTQWDRRTTSVVAQTSMLQPCTPYYDATGRTTQETPLYIRASYELNPTMLPTVPAGTQMTIRCAAVEQLQRGFNRVEEGELFYSVTYGDKSGWVPAKTVELNPGYTEGGPAGSTGNHFKTVANSLIADAHKQDTLWTFGEADFSESYGYRFENENLLTAILSLPARLNGQYRWEFDQTELPWKLNLRRLDEKNMSELRFGRNLSGVKISVDASKLVTCVLPVGADGLTVEALTGSPFVMSERMDDHWHAEAMLKTEDEDANALQESALDYLREHDTPTVSVTVSAMDLCEMTGEPLDALEIGKMCRVPLPDYGTTINEYITRLSWSDLYNAPERVSVTLANRQETASGLIAQIMRK